jgi:GH35 family endo-1,4-beta-xylanase
MSGKCFYVRVFFVAVLLLSPCYGDWKSDANARIELIRKRNAEITVVDSNGYPVPDVNVQIEQIGHRFAFGTCISFSPLYSNSIYRDFIQNHFEWAVCENETKWESNEHTRDVENYTNADYIYHWSNSNGIKMRGHTLVWETGSQTPSWVSGLQCATYPTDSEMLEEVDERINSAVNHFKNKFHNWDVDNEMLSGNMFDCLGEAGRAHFFQQGNSTDPNCGMFMNEYNGNSFGGYSSTNYVNRANSLINTYGTQIDGFGIQAHLAENATFSPTSYYSNVLQPLAALGRPIWATEFDAPHTDVTTSADNIENFFRICFSHPNVEGIIMWGFMESQMWRSNAHLITSTGALTERGFRYVDLLDEWTTNDSNTTDASGKVSFRGFHGTYRITLSEDGQPTETYTIELEPGETTAQFVLQRYVSDVGVLGSWVVGTTHAKESGTDRALVFIAHAEHTGSVNLDSVTYGGQTMTKVVDKIVDSGSTRTYVAAFILDDAGITAATDTTFSPSWSTTPTSSAYSSVFLANVNQSALTGATAGDATSSISSALITTPRLATNAGDMVIDAATCSNTGSYTVNNAFTKALELAITSADAVDGYKTANGADEIPSVSHSTSTGRQSLIGFVVQAPAILLLEDCNDVQDANYSLLSDLNGDCYVNYEDLEIITDHWLNTDCTAPENCGGADFVPRDGRVDLFDFSDFAVQWLLCNDPEGAGCIENW